jgi:hypothetical protein
MTTIPLMGNDPTSLALSPDQSKLYVSFLLFGNGTTTLVPDRAPRWGHPLRLDSQSGGKHLGLLRRCHRRVVLGRGWQQRHHHRSHRGGDLDHPVSKCGTVFPAQRLKITRK